MIIVTSLAPGHRNAEVQHETLKSWQKFNCEIYSMNSPAEIDVLEEKYNGLWFTETHRTIQNLVAKPMVSINAMIDFAIDQDEDLLLVNSDIILNSLPEFKDDGITIFSRYDFTESFEDAKYFPWGYDVFYIPKQFLKIFPPSIFSMGVSHWDHWLPLTAIRSDVPVYYPKGRYAYHKWHETQYRNSEWEFIGSYFKWHFGWDKNMNVGQIATATMNTIKSKMITV